MAFRKGQILKILARRADGDGFIFKELDKKAYEHDYKGFNFFLYKIGRYWSANEYSSGAHICGMSKTKSDCINILEIIIDNKGQEEVSNAISRTIDEFGYANI